ncbi:MAG: NAD-dependent epimerase/dehydratase [Bacteroidota bacterium]|jgi:dihydroflavonol-4-reductase|nr:NAD-dependent epimerase/dehydratase [Bacteroidota bacterium]
MNNKIIVTGASGHIGYHVAEELLSLGYQITLLTRKENRNISDLKSKGAAVVFADLTDPSSYKNILSNADVLFHLASENTTDTSNEGQTINNTFGLTRKVLNAAIAENVKTIIYTSSVVVLGRSSDKNVLINEKDRTSFPESPYVKGKLMAEEYCDLLINKQHSDIRRVYPSWVIGPNDPRLTPPHKVVKDYFNKGQKFYFSGGISIAHVKDVAKAHVNAWLHGKPDGKYIAAGNNITFKEFYQILSEISGHKPPFLYIPKFIIHWGAIAAKIILGKKSPVAPAYVRSVIGKYSWYDSSRSIQEIDYNITPVRHILKEAVNETKKRNVGLIDLYQKNNPTLVKTNYKSDDILLITGFPGWLGNRMLDIFMNGDRFGQNAINRKIRLLVQPRFKGLIDLPNNFEIVYGDITDKASLSAALKNVKSIYHLAGVIYPKKINSLYKVNEEGTKNLVDACIENGVRRILFMSTDSVCGYAKGKRIFDTNEPPFPYKNYGTSKYLAEKYLLDKTKQGFIDGTSLRGFWFFGPFMPDRNLNFFRMFNWKRQVVFGNGKNYRSISHVDNIVSAFIASEKKTNTVGKWYWIGNKDKDLTVDHIYTVIAEGLGKKYKPLYIPPFICECFSLADTIISWSGTLNATLHAAGKFHKDIAGDISSAEKDFGYLPKVGFEEIKEEMRDLVI